MMLPKPLEVDNSTLAALARCESMAALRYGWGWTAPGEKATLLAGDAWHQARAVWVQSGGNVVEAHAKWVEVYKDWAVANAGVFASDGGRQWENADEIVRWWLRTHTLPALPYQPWGGEWVECGFRLPLDEHGDIMFVGRLDCPAWWGGQVVNVEIKTTGNAGEYFLGKFQDDSQCSGYLWALWKLTGQVPVGTIMDYLEFRKLPEASTAKCRTHKTPQVECRHLHAKSGAAGPFLRSMEQLETWRVNALELAYRYRDLIAACPSVESLRDVGMQGTFNGSCAWCEFRTTVCLPGRDPRLVPGVLVQDPWKPLAFAGRVLEPQGA